MAGQAQPQARIRVVHEEFAMRVPELVKDAGRQVFLAVLGDERELAAEFDVAAADGHEVHAGIREPAEEKIDIRR
jgi:hypothetical protein